MQPTDRRASRALHGAGGKEGRGGQEPGGRAEAEGTGAPPPAAGSHAPLSAGNVGPDNAIQEAEILPEPATVLYRFVEKASL